MIRLTGPFLFAVMLLSSVFGRADHPLAASGVTSLTNSAVKYRITNDHHIVLKRNDVTAVIVDNSAIDLPDLPGHRAGYNGVASLTHRRLSGSRL